MRSPLTRRFSLLALALMLLLTVAGVTPATTLAQDPPPPAAEEVTPTPAGEQPTPQEGVISDPSFVAPEEPQPEAPAPDGSSEAELEEIEQSVVLPEGYTPPAELAELSGGELADLNFPSLIQGDIKLDLVVNPERVAAGGELTYTYIFTNTRSTSASNFIIRARWTQFRRINAAGVYQFCKELDCNPSQIGSTVVERDTTATTDTEIVYTVKSTLGPGQSGRFAVVMNTRNDNFPTTGKPPRRPSGSAQLADSKTTPVISEDTANALFVGPVFVITKQPAEASKFVNVGDSAEFTITVGNATATADIIAGVIRTDAAPATNIELTDMIPAGSEFVSAEGPVQPVVDATAKSLRWTIPGPLNPGQSVAIKVRFKKLDVNLQCGTIINGTYYVTSAEMPIKTGTTRFTIAGKSASVTVRNPLVVESIKTSPKSPIFGETAKITITVQSYWPQPLSNVEVRYSVQSNAFYVPGGAVPAPATQPNGSSLGGDVIWRINMPAGNATTPSSQVLTLTIRGNESGTVPSNTTGIAQIIPPAGVPSACMKTLRGVVNFLARLEVSKLAGTDEGLVGSSYWVRRLVSFPYIIRITNRGSTAATNLIVDDLLPKTLGANFSYVPGSATLGTQPFEPTDVLNGNGGVLTWRNVSVGPNSTVEIRYRLMVDGDEFVDYCNNFQVGPETVRKVGSTRVCVRINPAFSLTKTSDRDTIDGNGADNNEVTFSLSMVNMDEEPFDIALYDEAGAFEFVRMDDGNPDPTRVGTARNYEWPRTTLEPGERIDVRFVGRLVPTRCANDTYYNYLGFRFWPSNGSDPYLVETTPVTRVAVKYLCGTAGTDTNLISYNKAVDVATISTRDKHLFTLNVKNENPAGGVARTNVEIVDVLPSGFTYAGMGASGNVRDVPQITTRPDGRLKLTWKVSSIPANTTIKVQFYARSGDIVGTFTNWMRVSAPGAGVKGCVVSETTPTPTCSGYTRVNDEGADQIYAVRDVKVEPMATIEPSIDRRAECAVPDEMRTYQIALVNTNRHDYGSTAITTTLPLGLHFDGVSGTTPSPSVERTERGTVLRWAGLTLPKKPSNAAYGQLSLQVRVRVGQVWGPLQPLVEASSPDGSLPKKDGVLDPTVNLCVQGPAVSLDASKLRVLPDEQYYYVLSAVNPGTTPLTLSVDNTLDSRLRYLATITGPAATQAGAKLTWSSLQVPAATDKGPGVLLIVYKVQPNGAKPGDIIPNKLSVAQSSVNLNTNTADIDVVIVDPVSKIYLPLLRRP